MKAKDKNNWILCDQNCPIPSLNCKTPSEECVRDGVLQVCKEIFEDQVINEWCVTSRQRDNGTKYINHQDCPKNCKDEDDPKLLGFLSGYVIVQNSRYLPML